MKKAFTLIELLIVVAIIAILAAIAVPNFLEAQTRSKVSRELADARNIGTAVESYCVDYRQYPLDGANWCDGVTVNNYPTFALRWGDNLYAGRCLTTPIAYITDIPFDVFNTMVPPSGYVPAGLAGEYRVSLHYAVKKYTTRNETIMNNSSHPWSLDKPFAERLQPALWMMWSVGPSHNIGKNSTKDACWMIPYDPTNGTTSNGGIWRMSTGTMF